LIVSTNLPLNHEKRRRRKETDKRRAVGQRAASIEGG